MDVISRPANERSILVVLHQMGEPYGLEKLPYLLSGRGATREDFAALFIDHSLAIVVIDGHEHIALTPHGHAQAVALTEFAAGPAGNGGE